MAGVIVTTTDGEQHTVACPGVPAGDIDVTYIEQRTGFNVDSVSVTRDELERIKRLEEAAGVGGEGKTGIASRIDDLEQRIADLESHHS